MWGGVDRTALTRVNRRGLSLGPRGRWWGVNGRWWRRRWQEAWWRAVVLVVDLRWLAGAVGGIMSLLLTCTCCCTGACRLQYRGEALYC